MKDWVSKSKIFANAGSFWTSNLKRDEQKKAQFLSNLVNFSNPFWKLSNTVENFAGKAQSFTEHEVIEFKASDIRRVSSNIGEDEVEVQDDEDARFWILESCYFMPTKITHGAGDWVINVDYYYIKDSIWFKHNPLVHFPDLKLYCDGYRVSDDSIMNFLCGENTISSESFKDFISYYRTNQSITNFVKALHAVAFVPVVSHDSIIKSKYGSPDGGWVLTLEDGKQFYCESEPTYAVGDSVSAGENFSNAIRVYSRESQKSLDWWRSVDWTLGLYSKPILGVEQLIIPPYPVWSYIGGQDTGSVSGSKVHARFQFIGDWSIEDLFWSEVSRWESDNEIYLNSIIGFGNEGSGSSPEDNLSALLTATPSGERPNIGTLTQKKKVEPLDIFFSHGGLNQTALVIELDERKVPELQSAVSFIKEQCPIGKIPIIRIRVDDNDVIDHELREELEETRSALYS